MTEDIRYQYTAGVLKALAHPTRLFILDKLNEREFCVGELQELVGVDMSTISRHLNVLKQVDIIAGRKENNQVFYRLLCPCVLDFYNCIIGIKETN